MTTTQPLRRNRDFAILWSGDAVSELGTSMSTLVLPLIGYAITGSTAKAGIAGTAALLATLVFRLPAGALVDRRPRGRVLITANLACVVLFGSLAAAALTHTLTLTHLVVASALTGVAGAFSSPATSAAIRTIVPAEQRPVAYSRLEARGHAAALVGPPLGGALYSIARGLPFVVDAVSYAVAAVAVRFLRTPLPAQGRTDANIRADIADGLRFVWTQKAVRALMTWGAILNLAGIVVAVTVTLRLVRAGVHPATIGLVETAAATAGLIGALLSPAIIRRARTGWMTLVTGLIVAVVFGALCVSTDPVVIGALLAAGTLLLPANNAGISAYLASVVPDRMQGRLNAAGGFVAGGLQPFGPVLAGVLLGSIGATSTTLVGAALVVASLVPLVTTPALMRLGPPHTWPAQVEETVTRPG